MAVVKYNPITPGTRYLVKASKKELTKGVEPEKSLLAPHKETAGRNNAGHRTVRYRGGGHKARYRMVDFKRNKDGIPATVKTVEYDPNRSAFISLVVYADGEKRYIIAPKNIQVGQKIVSGPGAAPEIGNTLLLAEMPLGAVMHNIELNPGRGAAMIRSAGTSATMMGREGIYAVIKLQSGETRRVLLTCRATIGVVSNGEHNLEVMGKAGRNRWKGWRPRNRPVAMNPVDHPMGGGEGRASGGHPRSRKGLIAKGKKTRSKTKPSNALIISRKKSGK